MVKCYGINCPVKFGWLAGLVDVVAKVFVDVLVVVALLSLLLLLLLLLL